MAKKAPRSLYYWPFEPAVWLSGTAALSPLARAAVIDLRANAWLAASRGAAPCTLPNDDAQLARLARMESREWRKIAGEVRSLLTPAEDGALRDAALYQVWTNQHGAYERRANAGHTGGIATKEGKHKGSNAAPMLKQSELDRGEEHGLKAIAPLTPGPPDGALAPAGAAPRAPGGTADTAQTEAELVAERERRGEEPRTASARLPVVSQHGSRPEDVLAHVEFTAERRRREAAYYAELKARAEGWIADHPDEVGDLEHDVRDEQGLAERRELTEWQRTAVREAVYERVREVNGWPDSEQWIAEHRTPEPVEPEPASAA